MPRTNDPISPELREIESQIDDAYLTNELVEKRFAEAAWRFLAFCEERFVAPFYQTDLGSSPPSEYDQRALADSVINHTKWPLRWLARSCPHGGVIPTTYNSDAYHASFQLSELAHEYQSFESAYTWANLGVIHLTLRDKTIVATPSMKQDSRYEAYDRFVDLDGSSGVEGDPTELFDRIDRSIRLRGERFLYDSSPRLVRLAIRSLTVPLGPEPRLPLRLAVLTVHGKRIPTGCPSITDSMSYSFSRSHQCGSYGAPRTRICR